MSVTVTANGVAKAVLTQADCGVPPLAVTNTAAAAVTKTPADVPVIVEFTVSVAITVLKPALFSVIVNAPTPLVSWELRTHSFEGRSRNKRRVMDTHYHAGLNS
jgi:hypothetical protein